MTCKRMVHSGLVQGAGFRWRAKKAAEMYGVSAWVTDEGIPRGLCKAKKLIYITTAGDNAYACRNGFPLHLPKKTE